MTALIPAVQAIVDLHEGMAVHRVIGGNPPVERCHCGWVLRLGFTTPPQRKVLRAAGFRFSGGQWVREDDGEDAQVGSGG